MSGPLPSPLPVVILISGRGSNMQAIIEAQARSELPIDIRAVISNRPDAAGLKTAREAGIATRVIDHTRFDNRAAFDKALRDCIEEYGPSLVVLAGFMRLLSAEFVQHFSGRLLNIHPSLLPDFPGLDTHRRALEAGRREHGASVHFVTEETDGGPLVLQARVPVEAGDTPDSLARRVLEQEHRILPRAIRWFAEGRLTVGDDGKVRLDGKTLEKPQIADAETDPA